MDYKKWFFAGLAAFFTMFILSGIWYMGIMADFYDSAMADIYADGVVNEQPDLFLIALALFLFGLFMSYAYPIGYKGGAAMTEGARFGAFIGLLVTFPGFFMNQALINMDPMTALVDVAWSIVQFAAGGVAIAMVYAMGDKQEDTSE